MLSMSILYSRKWKNGEGRVQTIVFDNPDAKSALSYRPETSIHLSVPKYSPSSVWNLLAVAVNPWKMF